MIKKELNGWVKRGDTHSNIVHLVAFSKICHDDELIGIDNALATSGPGLKG